MLPRPPEVGSNGALDRLEIRGGCNPTIVNRNSGVLVRVSSTLGGYGVGLIRRSSRVYVAVLENNSSISKNKIYCSIYVAFSVELPFGVYVESILVSFETTLVEYGEIGA